MRWLLLAGMLLATPAHAEYDLKCPQCSAGDYFKKTYSYSEATLWNAPSWLKYDCRKRQYHWMVWRHRSTMCR